MKNIQTGKTGENLACEYLTKKGYLILSRNHRDRFDEIDIICRHKNGALVFCEVKTITDDGSPFNGFMPEDNFSPAKRRKITRAANVFLIQNHGLVRQDGGWQLDLIAIVLRDHKLGDLRHYENV